jgi:mannose-1-phosphate guanylyltransferase
MDIGTPERYLQASWDILEGRVETDVTPSGPGLWVDETARVAEGATLGPRAVVRGGCEIGDGAVVSESVLLEACRIGAYAEVRGAILASGVTVAERATLPPGAVIGAGARVESGARLEEGARVSPEEVIA